MKKIKYFFFALSLVILFSGCESDPNGRMPDDIVNANVGILVLAESSDLLVDVNDFASLNVDFEVDVLFDEAGYEQVDVMVVYNGDFENQYLLSSITTVPSTVSYSIADIVAAVDEISAETDITEGDKFDFFTSITTVDGIYYPGYHTDGVSTNAASIRNIATVLKGGITSFPLPVPCAFVPADFTGTGIDAYEQWNDGSGDAVGTCDVVVNAGLTTADRVVFDVMGLFTGVTTPGDDYSLFQVAVDVKTYILSHYIDSTRIEDEYDLVTTNDLFGWGLGRLWFEDFTEPTLETCKSYIQFTITPTLNDTGLWWGSTVTYYIGPGALAAAAKKAAVEGSGFKDPDLLRSLVVPF